MSNQTAEQLKKILEELDSDKLDELSDEKVIELRKQLNPYGRISEGYDRFLTFSYTDLREKYMKRLLTTSMIGFLNRMNAEWMVPVLRSALGDAAPDIRYIPFGLGRFWYEVERHPASGAQEWITVRRVTKRKIGKLFEWTRDIDPAQPRFNLFGPMQEDIEIPSWINYHGPVTPDELAANWYPRAAGMISLSEHDEGRPQVLLEAMAAGVPVICSRIPAHTDLLESLSLGKLAGDREDFLAALTSLQSAAEAGIQAERGRAAVLSAFGTWADCAQRYAAVYHDLMAGGDATCAS